MTKEKVSTYANISAFVAFTKFIFDPKFIQLLQLSRVGQKHKKPGKPAS